MYRPNKERIGLKESSGKKTTPLLDFVIDKKYLVAHTLATMDRFSSEEDRGSIVAFQNYAWSKSQKMYDAVIGRSQEKDVLGGDMDNYLEMLIQSEEFKPILEKTEAYRKWCIKEWTKYYPETREIMTELTSFKFDNHTVFITHPGLCNGGNIGNREIVWGHSEDFPHYFVVYMWHEILHSYLDNGSLAHAIIELLTDNEMRIRLNGGEYPPMQGHDELDSLRNRLLPDWKKYLLSENKDILGWIKEQKENGI